MPEKEQAVSSFVKDLMLEGLKGMRASRDISELEVLARRMVCFLFENFFDMKDPDVFPILTKTFVEMCAECRKSDEHGGADGAFDNVDVSALSEQFRVHLCRAYFEALASGVICLPPEKGRRDDCGDVARTVADSVREAAMDTAFKKPKFISVGLPSGGEFKIPFGWVRMAFVFPLKGAMDVRLPSDVTNLLNGRCGANLRVGFCVNVPQYGSGDLATVTLIRSATGIAAGIDYAGIGKMYDFLVNELGGKVEFSGE